MYDEKDHAHEGDKMGTLARVAWVAVALIAMMCLMSTCASVSPLVPATETATYYEPLVCYRDGNLNKLVCNLPKDKPYP